MGARSDAADQSPGPAKLELVDLDARVEPAGRPAEPYQVAIEVPRVDPLAIGGNRMVGAAEAPVRVPAAHAVLATRCGWYGRSCRALCTGRLHPSGRRRLRRRRARLWMRWEPLRATSQVPASRLRVPPIFIPFPACHSPTALGGHGGDRARVRLRRADEGHEERELAILVEQPQGEQRLHIGLGRALCVRLHRARNSIFNTPRSQAPNSSDACGLPSALSALRNRAAPLAPTTEPTCERATVLKERYGHCVGFSATNAWPSAKPSKSIIAKTSWPPNPGRAIAGRKRTGTVPCLRPLPCGSFDSPCFVACDRAGDRLCISSSIILLSLPGGKIQQHSMTADTDIVPTLTKYRADIGTVDAKVRAQRGRPAVDEQRTRPAELDTADAGRGVVDVPPVTLAM